METLFLILGVVFAVGMMILFVKYAKFIHGYPHQVEKRAEELREDQEKKEEDIP